MPVTRQKQYGGNASCIEDQGDCSLRGGSSRLNGMVYLKTRRFHFLAHARHPRLSDGGPRFTTQSESVAARTMQSDSVAAVRRPGGDGVALHRSARS